MQVETAGLIPDVEPVGAVRCALEGPAPRNIRISIEITVVLAPELDLLPGFHVGECVGSLFNLPIAARSGRQVEGGGSLADDGRARNVRIDVAVVPPGTGGSDISVNSGRGGENDVE